MKFDFNSNTKCYIKIIEIAKLLSLTCNNNSDILCVVLHIFFINFLDVPSAPLGPLEITNVTNNSADLNWKPSANDGGTPITGYVIEHRVDSRTFWTKAGTVNEKTTTFTVPNLTEDTSYHFRVFAVNAEGQSKPLESTDVTKPTRKIGELRFISH